MTGGGALLAAAGPFGPGAGSRRVLRRAAVALRTALAGAARTALAGTGLARPKASRAVLTAFGSAGRLVALRAAPTAASGAIRALPGALGGGAAPRTPACAAGAPAAPTRAAPAAGLRATLVGAHAGAGGPRRVGLAARRRLVGLRFHHRGVELGILLHHRGFLSGASLKQRGLARYFSLTERRFSGVPVPHHFQPVFQPVTEPIGERTRLNIFAFPVFSVAGIRGVRHSRFPQSRFRRNRPANRW
ncbi:hypothetical protein QFZ68_007349 [Streptomyces sp. V1I6]|nr:hypothetical protein [Streptomyces sp. V1I6]